MQALRKGALVTKGRGFSTSTREAHSTAKASPFVRQAEVIDAKPLQFAFYLVYALAWMIAIAHLLPQLRIQQLQQQQQSEVQLRQQAVETVRAYFCKMYNGGHMVALEELK